MVEEKRSMFLPENVGYLLIHGKCAYLEVLLRKARKTTRIESSSRRRVVVDEPQNFATKDWDIQDIHAYPAIRNEYVCRCMFRYLINQWRPGAPVELG